MESDGQGICFETDENIVLHIGGVFAGSGCEGEALENRENPKC